MNPSFQTRLQRMLLAATLALAAGWALALPSPKDIEAAVGAGQLPQAESMLREVLQAKPQSAKAHYELGQVLARQGKYFEAQQALDQAKTIDPRIVGHHGQIFDPAVAQGLDQCLGDAAQAKPAHRQQLAVFDDAFERLVGTRKDFVHTQLRD